MRSEKEILERLKKYEKLIDDLKELHLTTNYLEMERDVLRWVLK